MATKRYIRWLAWGGVAAAALLAWNGRLLWGMGKPTAVALLTPDKVQSATLSPDLAPEFVYPRLAIRAPLTDSPSTSPLVTQDWMKISEALHKGVDLAYTNDQFETSPLLYVTGHSSDTYPHAYASVFAALGQAEVGDTFTMVHNQQVFTFTVTQKKVVSPTDLAYFQQASTDPLVQRALVVTCWPPLTTRNRLVITGERSLQ